jgi:hypothetical protein
MTGAFAYPRDRGGARRGVPFDRRARGGAAGGLMHRIFLGLAVTDGTLMAVSFVIGFFASAEARGPGEVWHGLHFLLGLVATMTTLLVHSIVFTYLLGTGKWVLEVVRVYRMPDWVYAQALKNKRKAFPFELAGIASIGGTAWLGAGTDARQWPSAWHLGLAALAVAFNLGAFAAEYATIVAQARLLLEVKDRADRLRLAQLAGAGPAPGPVGLDPS